MLVALVVGDPARQLHFRPFKGAWWKHGFKKFEASAKHFQLKAKYEQRKFETGVKREAKLFGQEMKK